MQIERFTFNPFEENTYVLYDDTKSCVIIDPGCSNRDEENELASFIEHHQLNVKMLLNTHCHIDHILGNWFVKTKFNVSLWIHPLDEVVLNAGPVIAQGYGFPGYQHTDADEFLTEGQSVTFGNQTLEVLFVPGHAPGHVAFLHREQGVVIAGDVLFRSSIGRTDLPGGNYDTLISSIHNILFPLPDETLVYPGHGPETTIGFEKKHNPFCAVT